jgi:hypothetical protein
VSRAASLPASLSSLLERAPSPAEARTAVAFLLESRPEAAARLEDPAVAAALAQVTGAAGRAPAPRPRSWPAGSAWSCCASPPRT